MAGTGPWLAEGQVIWAGGPYKSDMDISKRRDEALMIQQEPGQSGCTADKLKLGVSPDRKPAYKVIAGIALPPLCARTPGPADRLEDEEDVIDEAIAYCRTDELMRRWVVDEPSEKLLVWLSRFIGACFQELELATTLADGQAALRKLATQPVSIPGERGFVLEAITDRPPNAAEGSKLRQYFRQCREEVCVRLLEVFYTPNGTQSRYWLDIAGKAKKYFVVFGTYQQLLTNPMQSVGPLHYNDTSSRS